MRVAAYTRYDREAASTRQRLLQYVPHLEAAGFEIDYRPLIGSDYVRSLATGGDFSRGALARAYLRRLRQVLSDESSDVIWVYAEMFPYLPSAVESLILRSGRPVVYDFDDAFFHQYDTHANFAVKRLLDRKFERLIGGAAACACGNAYLRDYALRFNKRAVILPTVVDTELYRPLERPAGEPPVVGWIGSPSTFKYLDPILPLLRDMAQAGAIRLRVVGAGREASRASSPWMECVDWSEAGEIAAVQGMDVGIMPLPDERWARGKSGYKLIQYMACGLPVIASPVGVNCSIVSPGVTGLLATNPADWRLALDTLVGDPATRRAMGTAGRARAVADYSVAAQAPRFADLLAQAAASGGGRRPR